MSSHTHTPVGPSEVRFNHGIAVEGDRPDVDVTLDVLRAAIGDADESDAAQFGELLTQIVRAKQ